MPKKFSVTDKNKWLEDYENGKSESSIANDSSCDLRTVKRGIEEARRQRDAAAARVDLLKQAVFKHQGRLLKKLNDILSTLTMPPHDWAVVSWDENGQSILRETDLDMEGSVEDGASDDLKKSDIQADMIDRMLRQHLRSENLWKILARRDKAYSSHRLARITLQYKVVNLLEEETGYKLEARGDVTPPFLYSYTTGDLFYRMTLQCAFGYQKNDAWQDDIVVDPSGNSVKYHNSILAEVPGKADKCRKNLLEAFRKMQLLADVTRVVNTYGELEEWTFKASQAVEEIRLLDLVPGVCKICRRLGM
ncbi:MAG TPA: hypothetical protein VMV76_07500 [Dehalococcoidia bacterium]|nr:hypothetical protein [Dehalococcoidia bacterium]